MPRKTKRIMPSREEEASRVTLPEKIKCSRCTKIKGHFSFSKNSLNEVKNRIMRDGSRFNATTMACTSCITCTGGQVVELTCHVCDRTKALSGFSKAQRRNPDKAKCWTCLQEQLDTEPADQKSESSDESEDSENSDESDDSDRGTTNSFVGTFSTLSVTEPGTYQTSTTSSAGGVPLRSGTQSEVGSIASNTTSTGRSYSSSSTASLATLRSGNNHRSTMPDRSNVNTFGRQNTASPLSKNGSTTASRAGSEDSRSWGQTNKPWTKVKAAPKKGFWDSAKSENETPTQTNSEDDEDRSRHEPDDDIEVESSDSGSESDY